MHCLREREEADDRCECAAHSFSKVFSRDTRWSECESVCVQGMKINSKIRREILAGVGV